MILRRSLIILTISILGKDLDLYWELEKYQIKGVLKVITGSNTLLISEGYPFKSSMINFVLIDGKPKFEAKPGVNEG